MASYNVKHHFQWYDGIDGMNVTDSDLTKNILEVM